MEPKCGHCRAWIRFDFHNVLLGSNKRLNQFGICLFHNDIQTYAEGQIIHVPSVRITHEKMTCDLFKKED